MSYIKYAIAQTGLYLDANGCTTPYLDPGDRIVPVTKRNGSTFRSIYLGKGLLNIASNPNDPRDHSSPPEIDVGEMLNFVGVISFGFDTFEFAKKLNDWIVGADEAPDPAMESLGHLHQSLSRILEFNLAAWTTSRGDNLAILQAHSATALQTANAFLQSKASRNDPVWAAKIAIAERDSLFAVNTFAGDIEQGFWLRPYSLAAISSAGDPTSYYHGWMPHIPDRAEVNPSNQVWDYRWALPAMSYAMLVRIAVLKAFDPGTRTARSLLCKEIQRYVKILQKVFSKIWSGIRTLDKWSDLQRETYLTTGRIPLAAADIYGGYYLGGIYFASGLRYKWFQEGIAPPGMIEYPTHLDEIELDIKRFARHWWDLIYLRIGLEDLLFLISEMQGLCDSPFFPSILSEIGQSSRHILADTEGRKLAGLAASLTKVSTPVEGESSAVLAHRLYEGLRSNGKLANKIIARSIRELSNIESPLSSKIPRKRR
ncbi:MAG: hypothetical protein ABI036_12925 [Fibrobacteria bacterium]